MKKAPWFIFFWILYAFQIQAQGLSVDNCFLSSNDDRLMLVRQIDDGGRLLLIKNEVLQDAYQYIKDTSGQIIDSIPVSFISQRSYLLKIDAGNELMWKVALDSSVEYNVLGNYVENMIFLLNSTEIFCTSKRTVDNWGSGESYEYKYKILDAVTGTELHPYEIIDTIGVSFLNRQSLYGPDIVQSSAPGSYVVYMHFLSYNVISGMDFTGIRYYVINNYSDVSDYQYAPWHESYFIENQVGVYNPSDSLILIAYYSERDQYPHVPYIDVFDNKGNFLSYFSFDDTISVEESYRKITILEKLEDNKYVVLLECTWYSPGIVNNESRLYLLDVPNDTMTEITRYDLTHDISFSNGQRGIYYSVYDSHPVFTLSESAYYYYSGLPYSYFDPHNEVYYYMIQNDSSYIMYKMNADTLMPLNNMAFMSTPGRYYKLKNGNKVYQVNKYDTATGRFITGLLKTNEQDQFIDYKFPFTDLSSYGPFFLKNIGKLALAGVYGINDDSAVVQFFNLNTFSIDTTYYLSLHDITDIYDDTDGNIYILVQAEECYPGSSDVVIYKFDNFLTGIKNVPVLDYSIKLYPNPASDKLVVEMKENYQDAQLNLYDITGKLIQAYKINSLQTTIDVSMFTSGQYLLQAETSKGSIAKKIIISK